MPTTKLIPKLKSLYDLRTRAKEDPRYEELAVRAAQNLGAGAHVVSLDGAMRWLNLNANETDSESGVVAEVNFCRDLI